MSQGGRESFDSLTGARGVCVAAVVVVHLIPVFPGDRILPVVPLWVNRFIEAPGGVAVPFFFVLSGFLLTLHWRPDRSVREYARIRVGRIFPLHVVMWAVMVGTSLYWGRDQGGVAVVLANLLLLQAWVPTTTWQLSVNGPTWSLSNELFMYALLPLLVVGRDPRIRRVVAAGVLSLTVMGVALVGLIPPENVLVWPPSNLFAFVVGILVAVVVQRRGPDGRGGRRELALAGAVGSVAFACVVVIAAAGGLTGAGIPAVTIFWASAMVLAGVLVLRLVQRDREGRGGALLRSRGMQALGTYSFAIYITHIVVLINVLYLLGGRPTTYRGALGAAALILAGTALASLALHRWVEGPGFSWVVRARARPPWLPGAPSTPGAPPSPPSTASADGGPPGARTRAGGG